MSNDERRKIRIFHPGANIDWIFFFYLFPLISIRKSCLLQKSWISFYRTAPLYAALRRYSIRMVNGRLVYKN